MEQSKWEAILSKLAHWRRGDGPGPKNKNDTGLITVVDWYEHWRPCSDCGIEVNDRRTTLAWRDHQWHERCKACKLTRIRPHEFGSAKETAKEFGESDEPLNEPEEKPKKSRGRPKKPPRQPKQKLRPNANVQIVETENEIIRLYDHVSLGPGPQAGPDDPQNDQNV